METSESTTSGHDVLEPPIADDEIAATIFDYDVVRGAIIRLEK